MAAPPTMYFPIKAGDSFPPITGQLLDARNRPIAVNPGDSVRFRMKSQVPGLADSVAFDGSTDDGPLGKVRYDWQPGDTDTPGLFDAEFVIEREGGGTLTIPTEGYITVEVEPNASGVSRDVDSIRAVVH